jgi:cobaltochelatase CobN
LHLLVRDTRSLDDIEEATDLAQAPADILFLSFSDSDLGAAAQAWQNMPEPKPSLRLAQLATLRHPMSVDLHIEQTVQFSRCVIIRLLGGVAYFRYGIEEILSVCRHQKIVLAIVPGDDRDDPQLEEFSTIGPALRHRLAALLRQGGPRNIFHALNLAAHLAGLREDDHQEAEEFPDFGEFALPSVERSGGLAVIIFYRAHLLAADIAPIEALAARLAAAGMSVRALFVASLKHSDAAAFVRHRLSQWQPHVVLNATLFSARQNDVGSPLDAAGVAVLQLILAGSTAQAWESSWRGLTPADLAMQVVLPELDGRLLTTAISFKGPAPVHPALQFTRMAHVPHAEGIALAAARAERWARLSSRPRYDRRIAIVLSDYPGSPGQVAHAVGLDTIASLHGILLLLQAEGFDTGEQVPPSGALKTLLCDGAARRAVFGKIIVAVQPDRALSDDRRALYHDPDMAPCDRYIQFYEFLCREVDALVHLGTHGTLEWLPGKSVALSEKCFPLRLLGGLPVIYPFIVNNPGEAAAAKRRLGAVTIGHMTPPLRQAALHGPAAALEKLIDEYAAADGLDRRRTDSLRRLILEHAERSGLLAESGVAPGDDALARLDAYLCDLKDMQIRDGLHVFGRAPSEESRKNLLHAVARTCPEVLLTTLEERLFASAACERAALLAALDGRFVAPGPAGAPSRGRADVLPTGRNLFTSDPRAIPTPSALRLAEKSAENLLRRWFQDHGEFPRSLVLDMWGSTSLRTGGEDFCLALVLLGARPLWDDGSARVTGIEILPLALLDRPRVDVTLRISGLFRDAFETQLRLFDEAVRTVAARDEASDFNPLAGRSGSRIFGPAPGSYGAGIAAALLHEADKKMLGDAYLAASATSFSAQAVDGGFAARVAASDGFVHQQDHAETDLLDSIEYAAHEGGYAAARGAGATLYHLDTSRPETPRTRSVAEEVRRVVRARAANPVWIAGMMRHGYRGAAEIARSLDALMGFATTLPERFDRQFDLLFDATLGEKTVAAFLRAENPAACAAMEARFTQARAKNLWHPARNDLGGDEK